MDSGCHLSLLLQRDGGSHRPPKEAVGHRPSLLVPETAHHCHARWKYRQPGDLCPPADQDNADESVVRRGLPVEGHESCLRPPGSTYCPMLRPLLFCHLDSCPRGEWFVQTTFTGPPNLKPRFFMAVQWVACCILNACMSTRWISLCQLVQ